MSLRHNPDPIKIVKQRAGEPAPYRWRCDYEDGRGRCTSRDTKVRWNPVERRAEAYCEKHQ